MELLLAAIMLGAVVAIIARPLRGNDHPQPREPFELAAIEAAKDAKYREILDAELDFQTGKLSEPDYREIDRALRGEAAELLRRSDAATPKDGRA